MGWKQNLLGTMNNEISLRHDAIFAVHSVEQKEWGERMLEDIFSTLHLFKPLKLCFIVIPETYENVICVGTVLDENGDDNMIGTTGMNRRVVHKEFGAGEIVSMGRFGQLSMAFVKFDGSNLDGTFVLEEDLKPELRNDNVQEVDIKRQGENNIKDKIDDNVNETERKLAYIKEMDMICAGALAEAKELEDLDNETLVDDFERLIRNGAGPGYSRVVFMKRELLRRIDRGDHL